MIDINILTSTDENEYFHLTYEPEVILRKEYDKKVFFGSKSNQKCRFCGKGSNETSFNRKAHLLPELTGNKIFFSNFECDTCNKLFSSYEDSLAKFGGITNTFSQIKGKRGIPKHKHSMSDEDLEVFEKDGVIKFRITAYNQSEKGSKNLNSVTIDQKNERLSIRTKKYPYVPQHVIKIFSKVAISLIKEREIGNFEETINWLTNVKGSEDLVDHPLMYIFRRIGQKRFPHPWGMLMNKRQHSSELPVPEKVLLLFYGLYQYQVFLPYNKKDEWLWSKAEVILPAENHIPEFKMEGNRKLVRVDLVDLRSNVKKRNELDFFSVGIKPNEK